MGILDVREGFLLRWEMLPHAAQRPAVRERGGVAAPPRWWAANSRSTTTTAVAVAEAACCETNTH